jgi:translation initiation factor IF-1
VGGRSLKVNVAKPREGGVDGGNPRGSSVATGTKSKFFMGAVRLNEPRFLLQRPDSGLRDVGDFQQAFLRRIQKMREEHIEVEGVVAAVLAGTMFRVELENKHMVLATICGKMRKRWVRITAGDRVKLEMSPYDLNKARITWRLR